ncbi:hypothetical protein Q9Q94_06275 [Uliginosibacterium sp. 31-16]|uniref:hypothetical protein n=1 Tax=Uliginosibacterium sp. 31-16 TaxID=3068315 RepID=UPI00273F51C5|nr:hypothetical protein [Uliginosibacterium sp. 31-16]MDP5239129.1 hypothetical protein [Uliginosibacterium sp. 31-16]
MKKLTFCVAALMLASFAASAADEKPNAKNVDKFAWGMHIPGSKPSYGVFVLFTQEACKHKYIGKLKGAEGFGLRKAMIYRDEGGQPGKIVGNGCWSADEDKQKLDYLGYQGDFNADKDGRILSVPWSGMFNASNAG